MLLAVLTYMVVSTATEVVAQCPTCIRIDQNTCYNVSFVQNLEANFREKVVIKKMAVLHSENVLFYCYEPAISDPEYYKIAYTNLDNPEDNGTIFDPKHTNFGTFDIDQDKSLLYLGSNGGIFTYGPSKKVAFYSSSGDDIHTLFFKNNLYFVKSNESSRIIVKKGDTFKSGLEYIRPIKNFVITKDDVIVFLGTYGLFVNKKEETIWLSKNAFFRGLTVDLDGVVYTWWIDEIYKVDIKENLSESRLVRFTNIRNLVAMTFDNKNDILFTIGRSLHRMTMTNATDC